MNFNTLRRVVQITKHLYEVVCDITVEDLLAVIRTVTRENKYPTYGFYGDHALICKSKEISQEEFNKLLESANQQTGWSIADLLDRYFQRDTLAEKARLHTKVISSTSKVELVRFLAGRSDVLYQDTDLRNRIIQSRTIEMKTFSEGKTFVQSPSGSYRVAFSTYQAGQDPLSGEFLLQYWTVQAGCRNRSQKFSPPYASQAWEDGAFLNLRDDDETLLKMLRQLAETQTPDKDWELKLYTEEVKPAEFRFVYPVEICYSADINALAERFGRRYGTKFETFAAGLESKTDTATVSRLTGKHFLIAFSEDKELYLGREVEQERFEQIAVHLAIEHMDDEHILCRVSEQPTRETVSAIWEYPRSTSHVNRDDIRRCFHMTQIT